MSATRALLRKETGEVIHTWRIWVLPGLLAFLGLTAPVIAALLPRLTRALVERSPGVVFRIPEPRAVDAYIQFLGNLMQLGILAVAITAAGLIVAEVRGGTAALALVKPLSRHGFVLVKAGVHAAVTLTALLAGIVLCVIATTAIFGPGPLNRFLAAAGIWYLYALLVIAASALLSVVMRSQIAAAVSAVAVVILLSVLGGLPWVNEFTPAGLIAAANGLLGAGPSTILLPVLTAIGLTALLLGAAVVLFRRREL